MNMGTFNGQKVSLETLQPQDRRYPWSPVTKTYTLYKHVFQYRINVQLGQKLHVGIDLLSHPQATDSKAKTVKSSLPLKQRFVH